MNSKSFTLIELMTVVAIVAILSGITLIGFNLFLKQGKIAKSMAFDSSIHFNLGWAMVGDWKMDDNAANSTVVDTSGNNNDGTFVDPTNANTSYHSVDGANGTALEFDGDDYVDTGLTTGEILGGGQQLTYSAWMKGTQTNTWDVIVGTRRSNDFQTTNEGGNGNAAILYATESSGTVDAPISNTQIYDGAWHHVVGTWDNGVVKLYVDGVEVGSHSGDGSVLSTSSYTAGIGGDPNDNSRHHNGKIDQVRIYSEAFSLSQVKYQYYTGLQRLYEKGLMTKKEYQQRVATIQN